MSLIRWNPSWDPFKEMEEMMNRLPAMQNMRTMVPNGFAPALDMYEENNNVVIKAQLPGIDPTNVKVSIEKGVLTISGETQKEHEVEEKNYYRKETRSGSFYRQVELPHAIKEEAINAEFCDGVLHITLPKAEPNGGKKIDVKVKKKA